MRRQFLILLIGSITILFSKFAYSDYVDARFDNLQTTNIGLEDNFNDGFIDTSKWSVEVARPGYGIWKLPDYPSPFIAASKENGELRFSGNGYSYFDYGRALISKDTFSGPFTYEIDLTYLSGSGTQWGACILVVKDDFTAIQLEQSVYCWHDWQSGYYAFFWRARHSCIDGTPGCPTSPGASGTPEIGFGDVKAPGPITFPIKMKIVYDGAN